MSWQQYDKSNPDSPKSKKEAPRRTSVVIKSLDVTDDDFSNASQTTTAFNELEYLNLNSLSFSRSSDYIRREPASVRIRNKYLLNTGLNHQRTPSGDIAATAEPFEKPVLQGDSVPGSPSAPPATVPYHSTAPASPSCIPLSTSPYTPPPKRVNSMLNRGSQQQVSSLLSVGLSQKASGPPARGIPIPPTAASPSQPPAIGPPVPSLLDDQKTSSDVWQSAQLYNVDRLGLGLLAPSAFEHTESESDEMTRKSTRKPSFSTNGAGIPIASSFATTPRPPRDRSDSSNSDESNSIGRRRTSLTEPQSPLASEGSTSSPPSTALSQQDLRRGTSLKIKVKKRDSVQYGGSTPLVGTSSVGALAYSSITPSPAVSFLSGLAERMNSVAPVAGVYEDGDEVGEYRLVKVIGAGAFSKVFEAVAIADPSKSVAIKIVCKEQHDIPARDLFRLIEHEVWIWRPLRHRHIVAMLDILEADDALFIVSELAQGGSLLDLIRKQGRLPEPLAQTLFAQILSAVKYLHEVANIVHRDIKCENILLATLDPPNALLTDFGLSEYIPPTASTSPTSDVYNSNTNSIVTSPTMSTNAPSATGNGPPDTIFCAGSLHYCAPEELRATPGSNPRSPSADIWSLGCVLYAMLIGQLPFGDTFLPRLQMSIINGRYDEKKLEEFNVSPEAQSLIRGMLTISTEKRWSISDICQCEWVKAAADVDLGFMDGDFGRRRISSVSIELRAE
ncbi:hypothetical protein SmJEL517_g03628 [Synchytrium microbalum]|uniref:Protein kinase domain-containing protein n=1 Tax=Synchytrium microbalum TaxID=1806994 RepID=A0A507BVX8_9FUNG|nr:uncharacterized protein SmJEL517_g03628 [Synchytrium microbalum]TPX33530.1 hypothetical protein SmJEL517_g03628 [Synchytrium microbalum]